MNKKFLRRFAVTAALTASLLTTTGLASAQGRRSRGQQGSDENQGQVLNSINKSNKIGAKSDKWHSPLSRFNVVANNRLSSNSAGSSNVNSSNSNHRNAISGGSSSVSSSNSNHRNAISDGSSNVNSNSNSNHRNATSDGSNSATTNSAVTHSNGGSEDDSRWREQERLRNQQQQQQQQELWRRQQQDQQRNAQGTWNRNQGNQANQGRWQQDQQRRIERYRQEQQQRQNFVWQRQRTLEQQRRRAQLRFQQRYVERLQQDQLRLQQWQYNNNSFYNNYRYQRGSSFYETSQYGAEMLRRAVNDGYQEGFSAGQADREDGWAFNAEHAYAYQDASYGYDSYYVDLSEYQYYFREGFRRGYEDGYYSRSSYGSYSNGGYSILGSILEGILNLQSIN